MFPAATIVVGECSFASRRTGAGTGRASKPQSRHGRRVWGDGSEQQSKGAVRPLSEPRGHTSGGSHPRAHYNVEQPTRHKREEKIPSMAPKEVDLPMRFKRWFFRKEGYTPFRIPWKSLFYLLLVLLPGMVLGGLALSSFEKEESLLEKRFRETLHAELGLLSRRVFSSLEEVERELYVEIQGLPHQREEAFFSQWREENPLVDIPFLLDHRLALMLPRPSGEEEPRIRAFASWGESFFEGTSSGRNIERVLTAWKESFASSEPLEGSPELPEEATPVRDMPDTALPPASPPKSAMAPAAVSSFALSRKAALPQEAAPAPSEEMLQGLEQDLTKEEVPEAGSDKGKGEREENVLTLSTGSKEITKEAKPLFFRKPHPFPEEIQGKSFGLLPYMMDNRLLFLFWARRGEEIGGCLLREDLLKERLGKTLSQSLAPSQGNYILAVLDEHGEPLFPQNLSEKEKNPLFGGSSYESIPMPPLLPYWSCAAFLAPSHSMLLQAEEQRFRHLLVIGSLLFSLLGGTFLLFRALRMEMRTAAQKTTFVAKVSHELKTPLTSLRLFGEMLQEGRVSGEEKRRRYLGLMVSEIERLTRLIENILDFSRRERGLKGYSFRETNLYALAEDVLESQRPRLEEQGFSLSLEGEKTLSVLADPEGVAQILLNLLTNAEKYSDTHKEVVVRLGEDERRVWIEVMDRGVGIAPRNRERIFQEFYRVDDSLTSRAQGAGLGLSISRNIARDHGGDLVVLPREGGGSIFRLLLPRRGERP